jgi:hypothetical protein
MFQSPHDTTILRNALIAKARFNVHKKIPWLGTRGEGGVEGVREFKPQYFILAPAPDNYPSGSVAKLLAIRLRSEP